MQAFFRQPHRLLGMTLFLTVLCWMVSPWGPIPGSHAKSGRTQNGTVQADPQEPRKPEQLSEQEEFQRQFDLRNRVRLEEDAHHQQNQQRTLTPKVPPGNDMCAGAVNIPATGPFPFLTSIVDITEATATNDQLPTCTFGGAANATFGVWYTFTPNTTTNYTIETCSATTGTTVNFTVLGLYTSAGACAGPFTQIACNDGGCSSGKSTITQSLTAGTTYYILAAKSGTGAPTAGQTSMQVRVSQILPPANDTCAGAIALTLDTEATGTFNQVATNDYIVNSTACFTNNTVTNTANTSPGRDLVYSFTAPTAGNYNIRVAETVSGNNLVLYAATSCPAATPGTPVDVTTCLVAVNRNGNSSVPTAIEELTCVPLTSGQQIFLFVDETAATITTPYSFTIEVTRCSTETASNDTPATATALTLPACNIRGALTPAADVDFFSLGTPANNSRVFAVVEGVAANSTDFDLRVTTDTVAIEYDDNDNDIRFGGNSPNIEGRVLTGVPSYLRVSHFSGSAAEPYRLFAVVQPPGGGFGSSSATEEVEPNNTTAQANSAANNFFHGTVASGNVDVFSFTATAGNTLFVGLDSNPSRSAQAANFDLDLLDSAGNIIFTAADTQSANVTSGTGSGTLTANFPRSPAEAILYRVPTSGTYFIRVVPTSGSGDYLLSIFPGCAPVAPPANTAPTFTPASAISRQQGSPAGAAVTVGTAADAETAAGSLTVTQIAGGTATGITVTGITNSNGTITAMVAAGCTATGGTVRFQVTDGGGLTGTGDVTVNVTANSNPTLGTYGNATINVGAGTTVTPSAAPTDNGSVATVTATANPNTFTGTLSGNATTGDITVTNAGPAGTYTITVTATDNCGATATTTFTLTVNAVNTAPTFTPAGAISRQQGSAAGAAVTVGTAADAETAAGSLTVTQIAGGTATGITVTGITNSNGTITALVAAGCTATSGTVRFQVTDGGGLTGTGDVTVNVTANSNPTLGTYGNPSVSVGAGTTVTPSAAPTDNGSVATVTATANPNTFTGTLSGNATTGVITVTNAGPAGTYTITVTATDNCGATATTTFTLTVTAANTPPTITAGAAATRQQGSAGSTATIATVSDTETAAGSLTVTATTVPAGITVTGITNSNGTITATVAAGCTATLGANTVVLTVTDGGGLTATANYTVNVTANTVPTLGTYPGTTVVQGNSTTVTPSAAPTDNGTVASLTATANPNTFTGTLSGNTATGVITVTNAGPAGTYTITVTATDNCGATSTATFTLTVTAPNTPPTITAAAALTRQQGSAGTASTIATVTDAQTPAGSLVVTATTVPTGLSVTAITNSNGTVSATVTASCTATVGANTVVLTVTDGGGLTATANLTVNVTANTAPVQGSYAGLTTTAGTPVTVTPTATPTDNGTVAGVSVTASAGYAGTLSVTSGGTVSANPVNAGVFTITVTATDNCGATSTASFTLTVIPYGKAPFVASISPNIGPIGTTVTLSGFNFGGVQTVFFNTTPTTNFTIDSANQITVNVPPGALTGPVSVTSSTGTAVGPTFTVIRSK
ncbi:MAG: pre-peptidase C-terminal domain-containing protein [Blastocatellia bacterium]|nr:pre-peptidase C-terminal domain-containing protein [Blastocatellia bacterium]